MLRYVQLVAWLVLAAAAGLLLVQDTLRNRLARAAERVSLEGQLAALADLGTLAWDISCIELERPESRRRYEPGSLEERFFGIPDGVVLFKPASAADYDNRTRLAWSDPHRRRCLDLRRPQPPDAWREGCPHLQLAWLFTGCYRGGDLLETRVAERTEEVENRLDGTAYKLPPPVRQAAGGAIEQAAEVADAKAYLLRAAELYLRAWMEWSRGVVSWWRPRPAATTLAGLAFDLERSAGSYRTDARSFLEHSKALAAACRSQGLDCSGLPAGTAERLAANLEAIEIMLRATRSAVEACPETLEPRAVGGLSVEDLREIRRDPSAEQRFLRNFLFLRREWPEERPDGGADDPPSTPGREVPPPAEPAAEPASSPARPGRVTRPRPPMLQRRTLNDRDWPKRLDEIEEESPWLYFQIWHAYLCPGAEDTAAGAADG